jgi:hypothetical protein
MPADLHIGVDAEKVVVSAYPIRTRTGRARRIRTGTVTEFVPVPPSGRSREMRVTFLARLGLPLVFVSAGLYAAGVPWLLLAAAVAGLLTVVGRRDARRARRATFEAPRDPDARLLRTAEERAAFVRAVSAARRVRGTWADLGGMVDPVTADQSLTHALDDLATVLVRRQEIRRLRAGLEGVRRAAVPGDSPAVLALDAQREQAEQLWLTSADLANRILRGIEAAALAGETFRHERQIGETARMAERALARLSAGGPPTEAAPDLADRTAAVLDAYRELERQ